MNLIEQLGGYERAKYEFEMIKEMKPIYPDEIETNDRLLLEYRRQHNIFEVGDNVIDTNYKDSDVQEIKSISGNRMNVFHKNKAYYFATFVFSFRHATDAEIKAGKRLEVNQ